MKTTSTANDVKATDAKIYEITTDCRRFGTFLPPQVQDWKAEEDYCEFSIAGMAKARMEIAEKNEFNKVVYVIKNDKNIGITVTIDIMAKGADTSDVTFTIDADVPFFLQGMIREPLQKVTDTLAAKTKELSERA